MDDGYSDLLAPFSSSDSNHDGFLRHASNYSNATHQHATASLDSFAPSSMPRSSPSAQPSRSPKIFDRFDDSSSDDDFSFSVSPSNQPQSGAIQNAGKKLDYMIQVLDRKLAKDNNNNVNISSTSPTSDSPSPLPEFVGNGGGTGIFKLPIRSAVRPDRPPCLEVRPHPLRETQIGCALKTIECTDSQLWTGGESGVRFWSYGELYSAGQADVGLGREGDEMSAPFRESVRTVDVNCLVGDEGKRVVWSGHVDGKIRCWRMDHKSGGNGFRECFSWQAHRGPVISMTMTSYGDLWSGGENGVIKIWPWEALEKALSLNSEERHAAVLVVERSYIDLKSSVTISGVCYMFASDVRYLLSDHSTAKVWSAGFFSFALWDSRTRELLKVFNSDGQVENWADMSSVQDLSVEDEAKMKFVPFLKKERAQPSFGFFQRSRNAILGAADVVRRVAVKGAFGEDNQRMEAMVSTIDGAIWTGCTSGLLVHWDGNGNRLQEFQYHPFAVQCLCTYGSRIWVGYASGTVQILDLDGNLLGGWIAHRGSIIKLAVGDGYLFTLANHGGIRGWNITSPGPIDNLLCSELSHKEFLYTRQENLKILAGTWNVAEGRASHDSLISWLVSGVSDVDIFVVGFQELEMGAGVLAMSAAKETVGLEGSSVGQWWLEMIDNILDEGSTFERVGSRQLAGLLIAVWVRNDLKAHVGDIDAAAVPCGFGRAIGNKGAVGLKMRIYDRFFCFVNCHFAAHLEAVNRRNADFDHVYRTMIFNRQSNPINTAAVGISSAVQMLRGASGIGVRAGEALPDLSEGDMVVFLGDFNYRLDGISYDEARDFISQRCFDWLRERDQLHVEMEAGKVFQGMREAVIQFPPTYKFEKHMPGLAGYDSGEKKRTPAWCDRILYRDSRVSGSASECSLDCPVVGSITQYEACMDVTDSDHKPVRCIFNVDVALVDHTIRRQEFQHIIESNARIQSMLEDLLKVPETIVSTNNIIFQNNDTSVLRISNKSRSEKGLFTIICEGEATVNEEGMAMDHRPRGSFGLPRWLGVNPASGIIEPDHTVEISIHHRDFHTLEEYVDGLPRNSWCEDTRDKEVMLAVKIQGSCTTETTSHRIRVRHCFPAKNKHSEPITDDSRKVTGKLLQRSNIQHLNTSIDMFDQLRKLHTP